MKKTLEQSSIVLAPAGGPTISFMGAKIAYKVTDGKWAVLEHILPAHFAGIPLHWHKMTQHGFYVSEGKVTFQLGAQLFTADRGAFVSVVNETLHTFSNEQDQPARLLEIIVPGGAENSFKELVALAQLEPASMLEHHKLFEIYRRYDTFMSEEI